jgi:ribose 5-phosphate isomerase B
MKIHLATDHAGFEHKESLKGYLLACGYEVIDHGDTILDENDDYPDFVTPFTMEVSKDVESKGVVFGGSGEGEAMCANRIVGARAVVYYGGAKDILTFSRLHNNANILSIGARFVTPQEVNEAVDYWLGVEFSHEERHIRRLSKF